MLDSELRQIADSLRPIHTEADYDRTVKMMNALLNVVGDDENHPLSSPLELTSDMVWRYEQEQYPMKPLTQKTHCGF